MKFVIPLEKAAPRGGKYISRKKVKGKWVYAYPEEEKGKKPEKRISEKTIEIAISAIAHEAENKSAKALDDSHTAIAAGQQKKGMRLDAIRSAHSSVQVIMTEKFHYPLIGKEIRPHFHTLESRISVLEDRIRLEKDFIKETIETSKEKDLPHPKETYLEEAKNAGERIKILSTAKSKLEKLKLQKSISSALLYVIPLQKAKNITLTGGHSSDSWDRRLKNEVLVPPPEPLKRDLSKETKKNRKRLKHILGIPLDVAYGTQQPQ